MFFKTVKMNIKLLKNQVYILTLFVRSFGSLQGASLRPSEVVRVVRRAMDDWPATPQGSKRTTKMEKNVIICEFMTKKQYFKFDIKPSLFSGMIPISQKLFYGKRTQFKHLFNIYNPSFYNDLQRFFSKKSKTKRTQTNPIKANPNPIKANFFTTSKPLFSSSLWPSVFLFFLCGKVVKAKNKKMQSKPNFKKIFAHKKRADPPGRPNTSNYTKNAPGVLAQSNITGNSQYQNTFFCTDKRDPNLVIEFTHNILPKIHPPKTKPVLLSLITLYTIRPENARKIYRIST